MFQKAFLLGIFLIGLVAAVDPRNCTLINTGCTTKATPCEWSVATNWDCTGNLTTPLAPGFGDNVFIVLDSVNSVYVNATDVSVNAIEVNNGTATVMATITFYGSTHVATMLDGFFDAQVNSGTFNADVHYGQLTVQGGSLATIGAISDLTFLSVNNANLSCPQFTVGTLYVQGNDVLSPTVDITVSNMAHFSNAVVSINSMTLNGGAEFITSQISAAKFITQMGSAVTVTGSTFTAPAYLMADGVAGSLPSMLVNGISTISGNTFVINATTGVDGLQVVSSSVMNLKELTVYNVAFTATNAFLNVETMTFNNVGAAVISSSQASISTLSAMSSGVKIEGVNGTIATVAASGVTANVNINHQSNLNITNIKADTQATVGISHDTNLAPVSSVSADTGAILHLSTPIAVTGTMNLGDSVQATINGPMPSMFAAISMSNNSMISYTMMTSVYNYVGKFSYNGNTPVGAVSVSNAWLKVSAGDINTLNLDKAVFGVGATGQTQQDVTVQNLADSTPSTINVHSFFTVNYANAIVSNITIMDNGIMNIAGPVSLTTGSINEAINANGTVQGTLVLLKNGQLSATTTIQNIPVVQFKGGVLNGNIELNVMSIDTNTMIVGDLTVYKSLTINGAVLTVNGTYTQMINTTLSVTFPSKINGALLVVGKRINIEDYTQVVSMVDAYPQNSKTVNMLLATAAQGVDLANTTTVKNVKDSAGVTLSVSPVSGNNNTTSNAENLYIVYKRSSKDVAKQGIKNNWKWIVIGVVAGLVVIAILVVVVRRYKRRHHYQEV